MTSRIACNAIILFILTFIFIRTDSFSFNGSEELSDCPKNGSSAEGELWLLHGNPAECYLAGSQGPCPSNQVLLPRAVNSTRGKCKLPTGNPLNLNETSRGAFDFQQANCSSDSQVYSDRLQRCVSKMGGGGLTEIWKWFFGGAISRSCSNEYYRSYARRCQNRGIRRW